MSIRTLTNMTMTSLTTLFYLAGCGQAEDVADLGKIEVSQSIQGPPRQLSVSYG